MCREKNVFAIMLCVSLVVVVPGAAFLDVPALAADDRSFSPDLSTSWPPLDTLKRIDDVMTGFARSSPGDALPHYWFALRKYRSGLPEEAVASIRKGLSASQAIVGPPLPGTSSAYMTPGRLMELLSVQADYACSLASAGQRESAMCVIALSEAMVSQMFSSTHSSAYAEFPTVIAEWKEMMRGKLRVLDKLGETQSTVVEECLLQTMSAVARRSIYPSVDVFQPLLQQIEAVSEDPSLDKSERETRLSSLTTRYDNGRLRQNRAWLVKWNDALASARCRCRADSPR